MNFFKRGLYTAAAKDTTDSWEKFAAMGLIGKTEEALRGLARFDGSPVRFYEAAAYWIDGDEDSALQSLKETSPSRLRDLIEKPQIEILAQVRHDDSPAYSIADAIARDKKFRLRNNFHEAVDFYFCHQIEYQLPPANLHALNCPVLGQTADYDIHLHTCLPWLKLFDALVVTDETEHEDVHALTGLPVHTFPKIFGVAGNFVPVEKEYDVFISGLLLHPYHPDKARLVQAVLGDPTLNVLVLDGMVSEAEYNRLLAKSRACFTFVRHKGAMPSRGIEALSRGCAVVAQDECALHLFFSEEDGVRRYDSTPEGLLQALHAIRDARAETARRVNREFAFGKCVSQYFRFLTVVASITQKRTQRKISPRPKIVLVKGGIQSASKEDLRDIFRQTPASGGEYAREALVGYAAGVADRDDLEAALDAITGDTLQLRFLTLKIAKALGDESLLLATARDALQKPMDEWDLDPMDDLLPYDYENTLFNYRAYMDLAVKEQKGEGDTRLERIALVLASIRHHLSFHDPDIENMRIAVELDPTFPYHHLRLMELGRPDKEALLDLMRTSCAPFEAFELLRKFYPDPSIEAEWKFRAGRIITPGRRSMPIELHWDAVGRVAIFGASVTGASCFEEARRRGKTVVCFLDNFPREEVFRDLPVIKPTAGWKADGVDTIILAVKASHDLVRRQLTALDIGKPVYDY